MKVRCLKFQLQIGFPPAVKPAKAGTLNAGTKARQHLMVHFQRTQKDLAEQL
jgi:hypothetical protein